MNYIVADLQTGGYEAIYAALTQAVASDIRTVVIPQGQWYLEKPVALPDSVTVILLGAEIYAKGCAFTNRKADLPYALATEQKQIHLLGLEGARIESDADAQIAFCNVQNFSISGIEFRGGSGLLLRHARKGKLSRLKFADCLHGVRMEEGCRELVIEDIHAQTREDSLCWIGGETTVWGRSNEMCQSIVSRVYAQTQGAPAVAIRQGDVPGHKNKVHHEKVAATCVATGKIEYWSCPDCGKNFSDEACTTEVTDLTVAINPDNHVNTTEYVQTDATCLNVGYTAGTYCEDCKTWISGHAEIPAIAHKNKVHHEQADATCVATGKIEYWSCPDCKKNFSDEACTAEVTDLTIAIDSDNHMTTTEHEQIDATYTEVGYTAGTYCEDCKKWISGHEEIPMLEITLDPVVDMTAGGNTPAIITAPADGWKLGENTFSVMCDLACMVAYTEDNGETYHRLSATAVEDEHGEVLYYTFDVTLTEETQIVVCIKGDINGNGTIEGREVTQIKAVQLSDQTTQTRFTALQVMIADVDGDGEIEGREATQIKAAQLNDRVLAW